MKQADLREADAFPASFTKAKAKIDVVEFDRQVFRIKPADSLKFALFDCKAGASHGGGLVGKIVAPSRPAWGSAAPAPKSAC